MIFNGRNVTLALWHSRARARAQGDPSIAIKREVRRRPDKQQRVVRIAKLCRRSNHVPQGGMPIAVAARAEQAPPGDIVR